MSRTPRIRLRPPPRHAGVVYRRRFKSEDVIDTLGMKIVSGELAPGALLPAETTLARRMGLSRPSLREGLRALARKGLVDARTRRGTLVNDKPMWNVLDADVLRWIAAAPPDPAFFIELLDLRVIFEPAAARLAAARATPEQILAIEAEFRAMSASLPGDVEACCQHDLAFHELIIAAAGNRLLVRVAAAIRTALLAAFRLSSNARESYENSLAEHWTVAAAIRRRDPGEAERAMRALLAGTARDLAPVYEARRRPKTTTRRRRNSASTTRPARG
jgi:GntR family transcriptional regulator, galactonate operon transcriptional repressor